MVASQVRLALLVSLALACGSLPPDASLSSSQETALTSASSSAPSLGAAANFAVLAGTAVTCTDATVSGNVGVYPGIAVTQTSCPVTGTVDRGDAAAADAHNAFLLAYDRFAAIPCGVTLTTLDGKTLAPGVYCFDAAATSTGSVLTLDGPPDGQWIFKIGTLGTGALTGTNFTVTTPSGAAPPCGSVYWWVAEAATMTDSKMVGTILAGAAITLKRGTFDGNAYAKAAVTITGTTDTGCTLGSGGGGPPICRSNDFVTGGGWIKGSSYGSKANFGVAGGIRRGAFRGHLTYDDHAKNGPTVKSERITGYSVIDATTRRIEGTGKVNGRRGFTWQVDVSDKGEPGRNDTFSIRLSNGYSASGVLGGGNIQLHEARDRACKGGGRGDDDDDEDDDHRDDDCGDDDGGDRHHDDRGER